MHELIVIKELELWHIYVTCCQFPKTIRIFLLVVFKKAELELAFVCKHKVYDFAEFEAFVRNVFAVASIDVYLIDEFLFYFVS
jgi:hypothetical protein